MPISVVSVVGAFRTGKSFLLDFMLRYLFASGPSPVPCGPRPLFGAGSPFLTTP